MGCRRQTILTIGIRETPMRRALFAEENGLWRLARVLSYDHVLADPSP